MNRRLPLVAVALVFSLAGCSGVEGITLPGGANLGGHPYTVKADLSDVLSLVPQSAVKVNDVPVGRVTKIVLAPDGWSAEVTMRVNGDVKLPANAYAAVQQSSLLGEKYINLTAPATDPRGTLANGDVIPISRTNRDAEVEEVLGALSLLLNGGGVNQLRTITMELNKATKGNESQIRSALGQIDVLASNLNANKQNITAALDGVDRLSTVLAARQQQIGNVLTNFSPGLKVLEQQRNDLVTMLNSLNNLSGVAVNTVNQSKDQLVADLTALAPTLQRLADAGDALPQSLQVLVTYPFTDQVLNDIKGDYLNVYLTLDAVPGSTVIPLPQAQSSNVIPLPLPRTTSTKGGK